MPHNDKARRTVRFFVTSWQRLVRFAAHAGTDDRWSKQGRLQAGMVCAYNESEAGARCAGANRRIKMKRITNTTAAGLECLREVRRIAARIATFAPHVARYDQKESYVAQAWVDLENDANDAEGIAQKAMMIAKLPHASRAAKEYATAASEAAGDVRYILQSARAAIAKAA